MNNTTLPLKWPMLGLLILLACCLAYWPGLHGPFLFDDNPHIVQNKRVHITDLSPESLEQAWESSLASGSSRRPLAQLTFGIDHALAGLSPFAYKATNLGIHLINGILVFFLVRLLACIAAGTSPPSAACDSIALLAAAIWLLHPLNLTAVLYVVQRMAGLSATFVFAGLLLYLNGRLKLADSGQGWWSMLLSFPLAGIGFLAKENAALYPLFIAVLEFTLLRHTGFANRDQQRRHRLMLGILVLAPLLLGTVYVLMHPGLFNASGRPFTLEQRLLTEPRILWIYLQQFLIPNIQTMGLFHDDLRISTSLWQPATTGLSILAWILVVGAALLRARQHPVFAFSVLFFLAGHTLESSIIPLELMFEHRNYVPLLGPVFGLSYGLLNLRARPELARVLKLLALAFPLVLGLLTFQRATDWRSNIDFILTEAEHHPRSPRANFKAAQLYIDAIITAPADQRGALARQAREHLKRVLARDPEQPNALFGLLVLDHQLGRPASNAVIERLKQALTHDNIDPQRFSAQQFTFFTRMAMAGTPILNAEAMQGLMAAALHNPTLDRIGKAGLQSTWRLYCDKVLNQPQAALEHATAALRLWPQRWHYRKVKAELEQRLGMTTAAIATVRGAFDYDLPPLQRAEAERLLERLRNKVKSN